MADEQYRWLDRRTAERLLSGESPDAVDAGARDQAERLAKALDALSATPPLTSEELPGEAAALAAFRKAREERADAAATVGTRPADQVTDAGLVRIAGRAASRSGTARRPRWARRARLGLAAALAVGMVGGVAVAAGTGVLTPFGGDDPHPGASVSAPATPPERPLLSPSPDGTPRGETAPEGSPSGTAPGGTGGTGRDEARDGGTAKPGSGKESAAPGRSGDRWKKITSACRDIRAGRPLTADRKHTLEGAAGGSARVGAYCEDVLSAVGGGTAPKKDSVEGDGKGDSNGRGAGPGGGQDDDGGKSGDDGGKSGDDEGHRGPGRGHRHHGAAVPSVPPAVAPLLPKKAAAVPAASPSPSFSAL